MRIHAVGAHPDDVEILCAGTLAHYADRGDEVFIAIATRARFIDAIREVEPEVMFVHNTADYHPDHRTAGSVAMDARIPAAIRLVETEFGSAELLPKLVRHA